MKIIIITQKATSQSFEDNHNHKKKQLLNHVMLLRCNTYSMIALLAFQNCFSPMTPTTSSGDTAKADTEPNI